MSPPRTATPPTSLGHPLQRVSQAVEVIDPENDVVDAEYEGDSIPPVCENFIREDYCYRVSSRIEEWLKGVEVASNTEGDNNSELFWTGAARRLGKTVDERAKQVRRLQREERKRESQGTRDRLQIQNNSEKELARPLPSLNDSGVGVSTSTSRKRSTTHQASPSPPHRSLSPIFTTPEGQMAEAVFQAKCEFSLRNPTQGFVDLETYWLVNGSCVHNASRFDKNCRLPYLHLFWKWHEALQELTIKDRSQVLGLQKLRSPLMPCFLQARSLASSKMARAWIWSHMCNSDRPLWGELSLFAEWKNRERQAGRG